MILPPVIEYRIPVPVINNCTGISFIPVPVIYRYRHGSKVTELKNCTVTGKHYRAQTTKLQENFKIIVNLQFTGKLHIR